MLQPTILFDVLGSLGLGQQIMSAAVIGLFILYLFRAKKAGGLVVSIMSTMWIVAVSIGVVFVLVIIFNWADPNFGKAMADITAGIQVAYQFITDRVVGFVKGVFGR